MTITSSLSAKPSQIMKKGLDNGKEEYLEELKLALTGFQGDPARVDGRDIPPDAETMIGLKRLGNIQHCAFDVLERDIPGDFIETGVWRGGACIFMWAILRASVDSQRKVWLADSFSGFPRRLEVKKLMQMSQVLGG